MALKGISSNAVPYIPEMERDNEKNPTVFWIKPKNTRQTYQSLSRYSNATEQLRGNKSKINPSKMFEGDREDFLSFCTKVENYEFGDRFPELQKKGIIKSIEDQDTLDALMDDLDPNIFQEIQDAASNWSLLKSGEKKDLKS